MAIMVDTRCAFTSAHEVEAGSVDDARLSPPRQIAIEGHLEEHEGRVDAVVVEFEEVTQVGEPLLGWTYKYTR